MQSGRFDLNIERVLENWTVAHAIRELIANALDEAALTGTAEPEIAKDPDGRWRHYCNDALARDYPALWSRIDRLLFLQPPGFETVPAWRWEQERALQARRAGPHAMDRARVARFVQLFERVSRQALRTLPDIADLTLRLDAQRRPVDGIPP